MLDFFNKCCVILVTRGGGGNLSGNFVCIRTVGVKYTRIFYLGTDMCLSVFAYRMLAVFHCANYKFRAGIDFIYPIFYNTPAPVL